MSENTGIPARYLTTSGAYVVLEPLIFFNMHVHVHVYLRV